MPENNGYDGNQNLDGVAKKNETDVVSPKEKNPEVDAVVAKLIDVLSMAKPKFFSKTWIKLNCDTNLNAKIRSLIKRGIIKEVTEVIQLLPPEWSKRWKPSLVAKNNTDLSPKDLPEIKEGESEHGRSDKKNQPKQLNLEPGLHVKGDEPTYEVRDPILEEGNDFWTDVLPRASPERGQSTRKKLILHLLTEFLDKYQPAKALTPAWIRAKSGSLYKKIRRAIAYRVFLDWNDVFDNIDKKWLDSKAVTPPQDIPVGINEPRAPRRIIIDVQKKGDPVVRDKTPRLDYPYQKTNAPIEKTDERQKEYEEAAEVDSVLEPYKKSLYLFLTAESKEDWRICDNICVELLFLARHGNDTAKKRLQELLYPVVHAWIDKKPKMTIYANNWQKMQDKMDVCFKNYNLENPGSFTRYLFKSLFLYAQGNQQQVAISLEEKVGKHGRILSEIISNESASDTEADNENQE